MMSHEVHTRENRLRRMAARQGLRLVKSGRRDPLAIDYGLYQILDWSSKGHRVPGATPAVQFESQDIDKIEGWLRRPGE